jgi:hypothetical protein
MIRVGKQMVGSSYLADTRTFGVLGLLSLSALCSPVAAANPGSPVHVIVHAHQGEFDGWPANNGVWNWGDEILVGFKSGPYKANVKGHSVEPGNDRRFRLARSLDGGASWTVEDPVNFVGHGAKATPSPGGINFADPNFAMRLERTEFFVSSDRGKTWKGPYRLPTFNRVLTARTDYLVNGPTDCLLFISAAEPRVNASLQDRAACIRTRDGGKTFKFLSWMTGDPISTRSVMPSTVRVSKTQLVSVLRRRDDTGGQTCWIDAFGSNDDGSSWKFLSKVADTGPKNGNPPSMVRLRDSRLVVTYGVRTAPFGIRARISSDNGRTWGRECVLRQDADTWDFGYTRTVQRADGRLVTIYYYNTRELPEQHIAATVWDPDSFESN